MQGLGKAKPTLDNKEGTGRCSPRYSLAGCIPQIQLANMTDGKDTLTYRFLCSFQTDTYKRCSVFIVHKVQITSCLKVENHFVEIQYLHDTEIYAEFVSNCALLG